MSKRVNIPKSNKLDGLDDDEYSLNDDLSQDLHSQVSKDVSEYDGNPKAASSRVYLGPEQCRKMFQLGGDEEKGIQ